MTISFIGIVFDLSLTEREFIVCRC